MKTFVAVSLLSLGLLTSTSASAQIDCRRGVDHKHPICFTGHNVHYNHHRHHRHHGHPVIIQRNHDWVAPVIGGVILGAVINEATKQRSEPVIIQQPSPPVTQTVCTEWREILNSDGTISRERICRPNN